MAADHSHDHHDDHHDDDGFHVSYQGYATGFILSVILTAIPFWLVMGKVLGNPKLTGLVILGFAAAKLCKRVGLPSVTGYMLVGLALGPSVFKIVGPDTLHALKPLSAFCLAFIFFLLGEEFKLDELRKLGPRFLMMTVI
jgi:hypothetical protein